MEKISKFLILLVLSTIIFSGCGASGESDSKKAAEDFVKNYYTVKSEQMKNYLDATLEENFIESANALNLVDANMESLMTANAFKAFRANRDGLTFVTLCSAKDYTMQATDVTLTKKYYDKKNNEAAYDFKVKVKLTSNKTKEVKLDTAEGNVGLSKENGKWKVTSEKMNGGLNLLKK